MSNTTQQPDPVPTEEPSSPAQQPTTPAEPPASSPDNSPSSPPQPTTNSPPPAETNDTPTQPPPQQPTTEPTPPEQTSQAPPPQSPSPPATTSQPPASPPPANTTPANTPPPAQPTTDNNEPSSADNEPSDVLTTIITVTPSDGTLPQTSVVFVTSTTTNAGNSPATTVSSSGTPTATPIDTSGGGGGGLSQQSKVAIGVVVPIAAIAILAIVGLFWWKKRRARQQAEEERRKEVEDYSYNPNADPTIPNVGMGGDGGAYEMREDGSSGYRGWGTTVAGSTGRKASTTMSGGVNGQAYSDATSPTFRGNMSDAPLMDGSYSPEGEILGQMGPPASSNRGGDIHRGPSNASSSYSAAARSEGSDGPGMTYGAGGTYYDQYAQNNPYSDNAFQGPPSQPIIRDNPARRNTRIESPSHYPQQSAGISQNF